MQLPTWAHSVHHDGSPLYVRGTVAIGGQVTLRLRAASGAPLTKVFVRSTHDGEQTMSPLQLVEKDATCQWWEGELALTMPQTGYRFLLLTPEGGWWLTAGGLVRHTPTDATDFKLLTTYHAPSWVQEAVFYQIFPDRFFDGDPTNNVRAGEYLCSGRPVVTRRWDELPQKETGYREFYGGDLQGISEQLSYLEDLGVTALYLNPIFTAPSSHKYDVADYEHVDEHFGGDQALAELRAALDKRGMRMILDIVPNHCGATHPWFVAARQNPAAPEAEFFTFHKHPDEYESWLGVKSLPKLNYSSERLRDMMYAGENAIMRRWLRPPYRIDGWRIDVANMLARQGPNQLGHKIGRGIRRAVKEENPEAYLLGEHFFDGTPHLQGNELDAGMNYRGFSFPLLHWLMGHDVNTASGSDWADTSPLPTEALAEQWRVFLASIPWQIATQQFNLLGSHDTPRILTLLGGNEELARAAATVLFTYPGVPCIYYGDEIGMEGGKDPDCRRPMPWDPSKWNTRMRDHYRALIELRRTAPALRWGGLQMLHATGNTIAFMREAAEQRLIVVVRRAADELSALAVADAAVANGTRFRELFTGAEAAVEDGRLPLAGLAASGAQIWIAQRQS